MLAFRRTICVVPSTFRRSYAHGQYSAFVRRTSSQPPTPPANVCNTPAQTPGEASATGVPPQQSAASRIAETYRHVIESNEFALAKQYVAWALVQAGVALKQLFALIREHGPTLVRMAVPIAQTALTLAVAALRSGFHLIRQHGPTYVQLLKDLLMQVYQTLRSFDYKNGLQLVRQQGPAYVQLAVCKARDAFSVATKAILIYVRMMQEFLVQWFQTVRSFDYKGAFANALQQIKNKTAEDSKQCKK